jgi:hypothetical protein
MASMSNERQQQEVRAVVRVDAAAASNAVASTVEMYAQALGEAQRIIVGLEQALGGSLAALKVEQAGNRTPYLTTSIAQLVKTIAYELDVKGGKLDNPAIDAVAYRELLEVALADLKDMLAPKQGPAGPDHG